jgi:Zn-finger nucleic acid-binding protein
VPLSQRIVDELDLDQCLGCAGVFISDVATTQLVVGEGDNAAALLALLHLDPATTLPAAPGIAWCPPCARPMGSCAMGAARVHVCRDHGIWLDRTQIAQAAEALSTRAPGKIVALERAAFQDLARRRRWSVILGHARALGARTRGAKPRGSIGLLADLFG